MELSQEVSAHTRKPFPVRLILKVVGYSSSACYEKRESVAKSKPGPKPAIDDDRAIAQIRAQITGSKFSGERAHKGKAKNGQAGLQGIQAQSQQAHAGEWGIKV